MVRYGPTKESQKRLSRHFFNYFVIKRQNFTSQSKVNLYCNILYCIVILCLLLNFIQENNFSHSNSQYLINLSFCSNGIFENIFTVEGTNCFFSMLPAYPHVVKIYTLFPAHSFFICCCFFLFFNIVPSLAQQNINNVYSVDCRYTIFFIDHKNLGK
jgi:hypothetical protein